MTGPTDDAVAVYALAHSVGTDDVEFDDARLADVSAWLATHDAQVSAKALLDASGVYRSAQLTGIFAGRDDYTREWMRVRAGRIASEGVSDD